MRRDPLGKAAELGEENSFHQGSRFPPRHKACISSFSFKSKQQHLPFSFMHLIQTSPKGEKMKDFKFTFKITYAVWSSFQLHLSNVVLQAKVLCIVSLGDHIYK